MGNSQGKQVAYTDEGAPLSPLFAYSYPPGSPADLAVNLNHFRLLRVVGKGAFGKVRIVERKDTGLTFALKYIRKEEGLSFRLVVGLCADRQSSAPRASAISSANAACSSISIIPFYVTCATASRI